MAARSWHVPYFRSWRQAYMFMGRFLTSRWPQENGALLVTAADRLRALAAKATPGPWVMTRDEAEGLLEIVTHPDDMTYVVQLGYNDEADARLIVLAPELALLAADMADALAEASGGWCLPGDLESKHEALLSRFEALTPKEKA